MTVEVAEDSGKKTEMVDVEMGAVTVTDKEGIEDLTANPENGSYNKVAVKDTHPGPVEATNESSVKKSGAWYDWFVNYAMKCAGKKGKLPERLSPYEMMISTVLSFAGILILAGLDHARYKGTDRDLVLLAGSFGASAVLAYDKIASPLAQPRNIILGHTVSAIVGVCVRKAFGDNDDTFDPEDDWLEAPVAVCLAILFMNIFNCSHPPGGATALIAVISGATIRDLGFRYISSMLLSALITVVVATLGNNLFESRHYPTAWWGKL